MIPVKIEDAEIQKEWGRIVERCHFCHTPTRHWHENTNNPVCKQCAANHAVKELPDFGKKIRAMKRRKKHA